MSAPIVGTDLSANFNQFLDVVWTNRVRILNGQVEIYDFYNREQRYDRKALGGRSRGVAGPGCDGQSLSYDFTWVPVPTGASLAGKYSADSSCFLTDDQVCTAIVWQFGNTLTLAVNPPGRFTDTFNVSITGSTYSGIGIRSTAGIQCVRFGCTYDRTLTISGTIGGGGLSGSVVDPVAGNYSFSLAKVPN